MALAYIVACVPPIALLAYIWYLDRLEHEPLSLVAVVFLVSGILGTTAAAILETVGAVLLEGLSLTGIPVLGDFLYFFCIVALIEELSKFVPVRALVWKHKAFNYRYDAVVYCVASAIGFAVFENITYVGVFGAEAAIARLIPVHTICGVFMGYFLACAKMCEVGGNTEKRRSYMIKAILIPVLIHGCWDFFLSLGVDIMVFVMLVAIIALTVYAWLLLKKLANFDAPL